MFRAIVVPVDLTDRNRVAVEMATRLARPDDGVIHLLHVIETIPGFSLEEEREFYGKLERNASEHLAELIEGFDRGNVRLEAEVLYGPRARTILEEAEKLEADLIVIQSHRVGDQPGEGLGTLSYQIGIFARCPVLLVK